MQPTQKQKDAMKLLGISEQEWHFCVGRYLEARDELAKLRVGLARIAQVVGADKAIPGKPAGCFPSLHQAAINEERGWNILAAIIIDNIEMLQRKCAVHENDKDVPTDDDFKKIIDKIEQWAKSKVT